MAQKLQWPLAVQNGERRFAVLSGPKATVATCRSQELANDAKYLWTTAPGLSPAPGTGIIRSRRVRFARDEYGLLALPRRRRTPRRQNSRAALRRQVFAGYGAGVIAGPPAPLPSSVTCSPYWLSVLLGNSVIVLCTSCLDVPPVSQAGTTSVCPSLLKAQKR